MERFQQKPLTKHGEVYKYGPDVGVLVLSSRVGSVGLTLTDAHQMVIFEPYSDVAMDEQTVKRFHRIGQKKDCTLYRMIGDWRNIERDVLDKKEDKKMATEMFMTFKGGDAEMNSSSVTLS
jgi:SNF2 family DNA or RNA helicase